MLTKEALDKFDICCPRTLENSCGKINGLYLSHKEALAKLANVQVKAEEYIKELEENSFSFRAEAVKELLRRLGIK